MFDIGFQLWQSRQILKRKLFSHLLAANLDKFVRQFFFLQVEIQIWETVYNCICICICICIFYKLKFKSGRPCTIVWAASGAINQWLQCLAPGEIIGAKKEQSNPHPELYEASFE